MPTETHNTWYTLSTDETVKLQETHVAEGLADREATQRPRVLGTSLLPVKRQVTVLI